jgi:two-component system response regulator FlrC
VIGLLALGSSALVQEALESTGTTSFALADQAGAREALADGQLSALILEADALDLALHALLELANAHAVPVLVVSRERSVSAAVEALRSGASDYLTSPFQLESLLQAVERLLGASGAARARSVLEREFVTADPELLRTLELAESVAASDATVLIEGESGTGKELVARLVHRASPRAARELVSVNCAALPAGLLESELFGHERGAFTGAFARVIGKFELAHGTTLLLDEISELELSLQAKLLRVIQEKQVQRVGAPRPTPVDFRLVATTNRDLVREVREGRFREDLFYRLNVLPLRLAPLRERPQDVRVLVEHFLRKRAQGRPRPELGAEVLATLERYAWPGNVRQLENTIERFYLTHAGRLVPLDALGREITGEQRSSRVEEAAPFRTLRDMERWLIGETLRRLLGNRTQAARELGISLRTLRNKIHEYAIHDPDTLPRPPGRPRPREAALEP